MGVWGGLGPSIIMFMASLKNIPKDYYEAADIDGAGKIMQFFKITLPLMTPLLFYFFILGFISNMQAFGNIYVMLPGGGPEYSGASLVFYLWQKGFTNFQLGYACSVAWILAIITFVVTFVQFKYQNRWVYSQ
jgi:multiple sugar transport system permease protein